MPPPKDKHGYAIIILGVEGVGKTTLGATAKGSVILMAKGETGYLTLHEFHRVPERPQRIATKWNEVIDLVNGMASTQKQCDWLVLDALGGFERLCHEHVCHTQFESDWGEKGFLSYHKGFEIAISEWLKLLAALDRLRYTSGVNIMLLSHCKVQPFKNPLGLDFDRYVADCHAKTWGVTHKWADAVLFNTFFTVVDTGGNKQAKSGKGIGGTERRVYTERRDAYDAKNRFGMPEVIQIPNDPTKSWDAIARHIFKESK